MVAMRYFLLISALFLTFCCGTPAPGPEPPAANVIHGYGNIHVLHPESGGVRVVAENALGGVLDTLIASPAPDLKLRYHSAGEGIDISFEFQLHGEVSEVASGGMSEKTLAVSDFHGRLDAFVAVLRGNGVVDSRLDWAWGSGRLIVLGDMLDRGRDDGGIAWLVYKLEKQAADVGGRVDLTPGNHEDLVMKNDLRYVHEEHLTFARKAAIPYDQFYGPDSELGRWIRGKNLIVTIGGNLFVHAGLSPDMSTGEYTIEEINRRGKRWLGYPNKERNAADVRNEPLFGTYGVLWYRGEVRDEGAVSSEDLDSVLKYYGVGRIIVGHSEVDEVEWRYGGRVIAINVNHATNHAGGRSAGLLFSGNDIFSVDYRGNRTPCGS
jgi:hypothetical protein